MMRGRSSCWGRGWGVGGIVYSAKAISLFLKTKHRSCHLVSPCFLSIYICSSHHGKWATEGMPRVTKAVEENATAGRSLALDSFWTVLGGRVDGVGILSFVSKCFCFSQQKVLLPLPAAD